MSAGHLRIVGPGEGAGPDEEPDLAAEALAKLAPREAARVLIASYHAACAAFDREVAASRARAAELLSTIAPWVEGGGLPAALPRTCAHGPDGCFRCEQRNEAFNNAFNERFTGILNMDDFAVNLAREIGRPRPFRASEVLDAMRESIGMDWEHTNDDAGNRILDAVDAEILRTTA